MSPLILRRLKLYQNHFRTIYIELKLFIARRKDVAISLGTVVLFETAKEHRGSQRKRRESAEKAQSYAEFFKAERKGRKEGAKERKE